MISHVSNTEFLFLPKIWKNVYMKKKNTHTILSKLYIHVHSALDLGKQATRYGQTYWVSIQEP
jgi:hypothetical protein